MLPRPLRPILLAVSFLGNKNLLMAMPVEPISLAIGAIALASLFTTCIECLDLHRIGPFF